VNRRSVLIFAAAFALMAVTAVLLVRSRSVQRLGQPGLKTSPMPGSHNLLVDLPENVLDYRSEPLAEQAMVTNILPKDTSYGQRIYRSPDGFQTLLNVVLMGSDRTSIHQPQFCLTSQGWQIDQAASAVAGVTVRQPGTYDLQVMKLVATKQTVIDGRPVTLRALYVYWFVAQDHLTARHWQRMWWLAGELLRTGVLERWAYVSCFAVCEPGREDATFERMKTFIASAVPQFQLTTGIPLEAGGAKRN
jgi:hypothetical protein